jgi:hypothetical protein
MKLTTSLQRWTLAALIAGTGTLIFAPVAQADNGWRRWKHNEHVRWSAPGPRVVLRERDHDGAGPALAGLIGGIIIGTAIAHSAPVVVHEHAYAPPPPRYRYEDMYSRRYWDSLDECRAEACAPHGPRVIRVVDITNDECVRTMYWKHDHWISDDDRDDWND